MLNNYPFAYSVFSLFCAGEMAAPYIHIGLCTRSMVKLCTAAPPVLIGKFI